MGLTSRVAVGLSGGVDSSVAASLLKEAGYEVIGLTMKIWSGSISLPAGAKQACFGPDEAEDIDACERLCRQLDIKYRVIDLASEYENRVLEYFRREYLAGRTPNPCVVCNSELKFGFLLDRAAEDGLDFDLFATGHYARIFRAEGSPPRLRAALDGAKDQSYFLYRLGAERLGRVLFPLGELTKGQVRDIARGLGLEAAEKAESQDFVAGGDYSTLFADRRVESGDIVDLEGRVLGRHRGLPYYTVGQRRGLGISLSGGLEGRKAAPAEALYVLALDPVANRVIVGPNRGLFAQGLEASDFVSYCEVRSPLRGLAKIRQNHRPAPCSFKIGVSTCRVRFDEGQRALAPGQSLVIYDAEGLVLGGGTIERALDEGALVDLA